MKELLSRDTANYLQIPHVYSTLKRCGNGRFNVVSTWSMRGVFAGLEFLRLKLNTNIIHMLFIVKSYSLHSIFGNDDTQREATNF